MAQTEAGVNRLRIVTRPSKDLMSNSLKLRLLDARVMSAMTYGTKYDDYLT